MDYVPGIQLTTLDEDDREHAIIRGWSRCSWLRSVEKQPSAGAFVLSPHTMPEVREIAAELDAHRRVRLTVDSVVRGTGYIAKTKRRGARDETGPVLAVEVEGALGPALASSIPEDFSVASGDTIKTVAENLLWPWGIQVVAGATADRLASDRRETTQAVPWGRMTPAEQAAYLAQHEDLARAIASSRTPTAPIPVELIDWFMAHPDPAVERLTETKESRELHPHPDELIGAFLPRLLAGYGLVLLEGADGSAILTAPDYEVRADRARIEKRISGGTVHEGTVVESDLEEVYARIGEVTVRGKRRKEGREVVAVKAMAQDADLAAGPWRALRTVHVTDPSIRDQSEAQRRADTMLNESRFGGYRYSARLAGYAVGPRVIMRDTMISVLDEEHEVDRDLYVVSDEIEFSMEGPSLRVECALPGTWTVG